MCLINYCFSINIDISNISTSFQVPMKIIKHTTNVYTYYEKHD